MTRSGGGAHHRPSAIGVLSVAVARLEANPMPARLEGPTRRLLERVAPRLPFLQRAQSANRWLTCPPVMRPPEGGTPGTPRRARPRSPGARRGLHGPAHRPRLAAARPRGPQIQEPVILVAWSQLAACAAVIGLAGVRLSHYGDVIAEKSGASRGWIGVVLLATITSLPELVTGLSSVTVAQTPDIALGDVMGSCVVNLSILVLVDLVHRRESFYSRAGQGHLLSAGFGVVMIGFAGFALLLSHLGLVGRIGHVGLATPVLLALYVLAMRTIFQYEREHVAEFVEEYHGPYAGLSLRQASWGYARWALVVVAAGAWLPFVGERLAHEMGWQQSFVGSLFVAISTSLPEIAVTLAAVRMGAIDLAIGNLLGSNLFNIVILALDDLAYLRGPLFADTSPVHAVSAFSAVVMTGLAIVGLFSKPRRRVFRLVAWTSVLLLTVYLLNAYILFRYAG